MKLKNLTLNLSKKDILDLLTFQDKVSITELTLNNNITVKGLYKVVGMNIEFEGQLELKGYKSNVINIEISNVLVNKKAPTNPLVKGTISILTKSLNEIEGFNLKDNKLEFNIEKSVEYYCTESYGIKLDNLEIGNVSFKNNEFEIIVNDIEASIVPQPGKKKKKSRK